LFPYRPLGQRLDQQLSSDPLDFQKPDLLLQPKQPLLLLLLPNFPLQDEPSKESPSLLKVPRKGKLLIHPELEPLQENRR